jgi:hypothetical protein
MTKPWRVDVLQCRGSSYDVGKRMAEGFLKTARGSTFHRRKGHQPFGFVLKTRRRLFAPTRRISGKNCTDWQTASRFHWSGPPPNTRIAASAFRNVDAPQL